MASSKFAALQREKRSAFKEARNKMLAWITTHVLAVIGIAVAAIVGLVLIGVALTGGFSGGGSNGNGQTASANDGKCQNGNLFVNNCQPSGGQAQAGAQQNATSGQYNLPPQPQIGHPSMYLETGKPCNSTPLGSDCTDVDAHTKHYRFDLVPGSVAIIGGFTVDGVSNGVYKAVRSGTVDTTVTDGFVLAVQNDWGNAEWCFRIGQAIQYGWAHQTEQPLPGWNCNGGNTQPSGSQPSGQSQQSSGACSGTRQETGVGKTVNFSRGACVDGVDIVLDNGTVYHSCTLMNAPSGGKVTTGVLFPNKDEIAKSKSC